MNKRLYIGTLFILFSVGLPGLAFSQELEPRALTNLPIGMNFVVAGYAFASGNILMDPALPLEDFKGKLHTTYIAYARSVNFLGKSGKIDAVLPFGGGDWEGYYNREYFEDHSTGFGDLRIRATINLSGAQALKATQFSTYKQKTVSGLSVQLIIPTGNYKSGQLPNLGSNRLAIRTAYGISHTVRKWIIEGYAGFWWFGNNNYFLTDKKLEQSPLWVIKGHLTHTFKKGMWLAMDLGYGYGAETWIDEEKRDAILSRMRLGLTYTLPIYKNHTLKFFAVSGIRFEEGGDFDAFGITYQYRWLNKKQENK